MNYCKLYIHNNIKYFSSLVEKTRKEEEENDKNYQFRTS